MDLRRSVETSSSLKDLHIQLIALVKTIPGYNPIDLRKHSQTLAFRAQLNDSIRVESVSILSLELKHALCSIIDQCEDDDEAIRLCTALQQHIGAEVEMYTNALAVDPDQKLYQSGYSLPGQIG